MPQIGRELDHLPRRVLARAIPVDQRPDGEAVAQVMDARAVPMPVELLRGAQPDRLADGGEVVSGAAVGEASAAIRHEERLRWGAQQSIPFPGIGSQSGRRAVGDRQESGLPELSASERQYARVEIDISDIEGESLR